MTLAAETVETLPEAVAEPTNFVPDVSTLKRFTVAEYHKMIDAGAFDRDEPQVC